MQGLVIQRDKTMTLIPYEWDIMRDNIDTIDMRGTRITPIEIDGVVYDKMWIDEDGYAKNLDVNLYASILYCTDRIDPQTKRPLHYEILGVVILGRYEWDRVL